MKNDNTKIRCCVASLGVWFAACARDSVSLGDDGQTEAFALSASCASDPFIEGDVLIASQAELAALAGCEEISGNLVIEVFDGADLGPLAALRIVGGQLTIGATPSTSDPESTSALIDAGWLESFAGVEALEEVGGLSLANFAASDLSPFSSLRDIDEVIENGRRGGNLNITHAKNLVDFRGFEHVDGIEALLLEELPSLESLDGLFVRPQLASLSLSRVPNLKNIDALASLERSETIVIAGTGLEHLRGLSALQRADTFAVLQNPLLEDSSSFPRAMFDSLFLEQNPKLRGALEVSASFLTTTMQFSSNDELERIDIVPPTEDAHPTDFPCGGIHIGYNAKLRSIGSPGGCGLADVVEIVGNPSLESVDLDGIPALDQLQLRDNPVLSQFAHASLQHIDIVEIVNNPQLPIASLAAIPAFEQTIEGNADSPAP
jgi:hypothetical protein